jgi:hypothetical protein
MPRNAEAGSSVLDERAILAGTGLTNERLRARPNRAAGASAMTARECSVKPFPQLWPRGGAGPGPVHESARLTVTDPTAGPPRSVANLRGTIVAGFAGA